MVNYYKLNLSITGTEPSTQDSVLGLSWDGENGRYEGSWSSNKYSSDRQFIRLRTEFNEDVSVKWSGTLIPTSSGYGPAIGYFNSSYNHMDKDCLFVALVNNKLAAGCSSSSGSSLIVYDETSFEVGDSVNFVATYTAGSPSGDVSGACFNVYINTPTVHAFAGPCPSDFLVDSFGVSNIDFYNIDDIWSEAIPGARNTGAAYISYLGYTDPTLYKYTQYVPKLYSIPDTGEIFPLVGLTDSVDYTLVGTALNFNYNTPEDGWAERVFYKNDLLENTYGKLARILVEEKSKTTDAYKAIIQGVFKSLWRGPTAGNIASGARVLMGLPFMDKDGLIQSIDTIGESIVINVQYIDQAVNTFQFKSVFGLAKHPTEVTRDIAQGDFLYAGTSLSGGIDCVDYIKEPNWYVTMGYDEWKKYYTFGVRFDEIAADWLVLGAMISVFLTSIKPTGSMLTLMRKNNTPLLQFDNYDHYPYVLVNPLGDSIINIPANYYYNSKKDMYYISPDRYEEITEVYPSFVPYTSEANFYITDTFYPGLDVTTAEVLSYAYDESSFYHYLSIVDSSNDLFVYESTDLNTWTLHSQVTGDFIFGNLIVDSDDSLRIYTTSTTNVAESYVWDGNDWVVDLAFSYNLISVVDAVIYEDFIALAIYDINTSSFGFITSTDAGVTYDLYPIEVNADAATYLSFPISLDIKDEEVHVVYPPAATLPLTELKYNTYDIYDGSLITSENFYNVSYGMLDRSNIRLNDWAYSLISTKISNPKLVSIQGQQCVWEKTTTLENSYAKIFMGKMGNYAIIGYVYTVTGGTKMLKIIKGGNS
jgi:hypothetical protein